MTIVHDAPQSGKPSTNTAPFTSPDEAADSAPPYAHTPQTFHENIIDDPRVSLRVGQQEGAGHRFLKAFGVALGVWLILSLTTRSVVSWGLRHRSVDRTAGPYPDDGSVVTCLEGADWVRDKDHPPRELPFGSGFEVTTTFKLPIDSEELYLLARGAHSSGTIDIVPFKSELGDAVVQINATYDDYTTMEEARVCSLKKGDGHGVGVFTSERSWPWAQRKLNWKIVVSVPAGAALKALNTKMSNFRHKVDGKTLRFNTLNLSTSNAPVGLQSIVATSLTARTSNARISGDGVHAIAASVRSSNGGISGTWNITEKVDLHTSNAPITAHVTLYNGDAAKPAEAELTTSNGVVTSEFTLVAATESGWGGAFAVTARSSNSPLSVIVSDSPADSTLSMHARTSNARVSAVMHRAFEGTYHARTSNERIELHTPDVEDPRGEGRKRIGEGSGSKRQTKVQGRVRWGDEEDAKGNLVLETSNGPIDLTL